MKYLLTVVLVLTLTACGSSSDDSSTPVDPITPPPEPIITCVNEWIDDSVIDEITYEKLHTVCSDGTSEKVMNEEFTGDMYTQMPIELANARFYDNGSSIDYPLGEDDYSSGYGQDLYFIRTDENGVNIYHESRHFWNRKTVLYTNGVATSESYSTSSHTSITEDSKHYVNAQFTRSLADGTTKLKYVRVVTFSNTNGADEDVTSEDILRCSPSYNTCMYKDTIEYQFPSSAVLNDIFNGSVNIDTNPDSDWAVPIINAVLEELNLTL